MKGISLLLISFTITNTIFSQSFNENKEIYNFRPYTYEESDPYRPCIMGASSLIIPGLGQFFMKEAERGAAFLGGYFGSFGVFLTGTLILWGEIVSESQNNLASATFIYTGITSMGIIHVWSAYDAFRVARINNLAFRDSRVNLELKLSPDIKAGGIFPDINTYRGLILILNF